jgi:hypothetical protein
MNHEFNRLRLAGGAHRALAGFRTFSASQATENGMHSMLKVSELAFSKSRMLLSRPRRWLPHWEIVLTVLRPAWRGGIRSRSESHRARIPCNGVRSSVVVSTDEGTVGLAHDRTQRTV